MCAGVSGVGKPRVFAASVTSGFLIPRD